MTSTVRRRFIALGNLVGKLLALMVVVGLVVASVILGGVETWLGTLALLLFSFVNWYFIECEINMGKVYYIGQGIVLALWALVDSGNRRSLLIILAVVISHAYIAKAEARKARQGRATAGEARDTGVSLSLSEGPGNLDFTVGPGSAASDATERVSGRSLYDTDFYAWTQQQAALLCDKKWQNVDTFNVMWESEQLGLNQRDEMCGRLRELVMQLLKWSYQPDMRTFGINSIDDRVCTLREKIAEVLEQSPSLRLEVTALLAEGYRHARRRAASQTRLPLVTFPETCPWTAAQVLNKDFWPEETR